MKQETKFTLFILVAFIISFFLKGIKMEPYPNFFLPGGPSILEIDNSGEFTVFDTKLYGMKEGYWKEVDKEIFSGNASNYLFRRDFGFSIELSRTDKLRREIVSLFSDEVVLELNDIRKRVEFYDWVNDRLLEQKFGSGEIKIAKIKKSILNSNRNIINCTVFDEQIIRLP